MVILHDNRDISTPIMLSVITVVKNAEATISKTISSVAPFPNVEYLVIDGESSDLTVNQILIHQSQIDYLESERDKGLYFAMNKGLNLAKGTYVSFINSDDFYLNGTFELVLDTMKRLGDIDVFYGKMINGMTREILNVEDSNLAFQMIPHPASFVRTELAKEIGGFDTNFQVCADYKMMLELKARGAKFHKIDVALTEVAPGGFSEKHKRISIRETSELQMTYSHKTRVWKIFRRLWLTLGSSKVKLKITNIIFR